MNTAKRVLPADVYDALELSALAFGGVGRDWYAESSLTLSSDLERGAGEPRCILGHAYFVTGDRALSDQVLADADINTIANDRAVTAINARRGSIPRARVSFEEWCAELGVERGQ